MTSRVYKSAQGKNVDLGALALQNEKMLAVSPGAKVNARGDRLDTNNRVVDKKSSQVQRQITQTTQVVNTSDAPIYTSSKAAKEAKAAKTEKTAPKPVAKTQAPVVQPAIEVVEAIDTLAGLDDETTTAPEVSATSNEGLAAAIARAKNKKAKE
jgi:hypothetical protein